MDLGLRGKSAMLTGGKGIGKAIALRWRGEVRMSPFAGAERPR